MYGVRSSWVALPLVLGRIRALSQLARSRPNAKTISLLIYVQ